MIAGGFKGEEVRLRGMWHDFEWLLIDARAGAAASAAARAALAARPFDEAADGPKLSFRAGRPGIRPCVHQGAERRLTPGCGFAAGSRLPGPADQRIARRVFHDLVQRPTAVARGIFQLHADVDQRLMLPRHGSRRQVPFGMTRNSSGMEIRFLVTGRAPHRGDAVAVVAALNRWLMWIAVALRRTVSVRMAVQTAPMSEHLTRFDEESGRARRGTGDAGERIGRSKRALFVRARRGGNDDDGENGDERYTLGHMVRVPAGDSRANGSRRTR